MNTYSIYDEQFKNTNLYHDFIKENPALGYLRIRTYSASEAIPVSEVEITISTIYKNNKLIFFKGKTNNSGLIEKISLPTPRLIQDNLDEPNKILYEIRMIYPKENMNNSYTVNIYEGISTVQNISITPASAKEEYIVWQ